MLRVAAEKVSDPTRMVTTGGDWRCGSGGLALLTHKGNSLAQDLSRILIG